MEIKLLHYTPLSVADTAIAKCWDKQCETTNYERIKRVGVKFKHASTLEHVSYNFDISGISRACLQELARHRISSFSVKSSRYTLKELKKAKPADMNKFLVETGNLFVDAQNIRTLVEIKEALNKNISNDIAKYMLPEAYKTSLVWTVNIRSLRNFLSLRTDKSALWEIRRLAASVYSSLPEDHKYLFGDTMKIVSPEMREEHFNETGEYVSDEKIIEWYKD